MYETNKVWNKKWQYNNQNVPSIWVQFDNRLSNRKEKTIIHFLSEADFVIHIYFPRISNWISAHADVIKQYCWCGNRFVLYGNIFKGLFELTKGNSSQTGKIWWWQMRMSYWQTVDLTGKCALGECACVICMPSDLKALGPTAGYAWWQGEMGWAYTLLCNTTHGRNNMQNGQT